MSERLGEALLDLDTNDKRFNEGIDRAEKKANSLGKTLDDVRDKAVQVGKALAVGTFVSFSAGIVLAVKRLEEARKSAGQVDQALKNSGNTARTSAKEIEAWADKLEDRTGRAAEEVMAVSANLASFGFGRAQFFRAITLADDMSAAWGGDLKQNLEGLSRALDDPINGMAMLSKRGVQLTDEQKQLAQSFLEVGDKAAAQGVVFDALEAQVKGVAEAGFQGLTRSIAQAQKAWETAFEDLVQGNGKTGDLRDTLVDLADTLSSPDFISAVMGFGTLVIRLVDGIAQVAIGAQRAIQDLYSAANAPGGGLNTLAASTAPLNERALPVMQQQLVAKQAALAKSLQGGGGWFGSNVGADADRKSLQGEIQALTAAIAARSNPSAFDVNGVFEGLSGQAFDSPEDLWKALDPGTMTGQSPFDPYEGFSYSGKGGGSKTDKAAQLIESLKTERDLLREMDPVQQRLIQLRDQLASATTTQRDEVEALVTAIQEETTAWENSQAAAQLFGDWASNSLEGLRKGTKSVTDVVNDLVDTLAQAVLQSMLLGQGPLAGLFGSKNSAGGVGGLFGGLFSGGGLGGLFSGFFAKGGLIPSGTFGIVGERGPEPVIGTSRGAMVLPNSSLSSGGGGGGEGGRGDIYVTIHGSQLTQSELAQAVSDGIENYDRHRLPQRVADINADPLARG